MEMLEKRPFFWADMVGLGKYSMGGYGRIGVYRVMILDQPERTTQSGINLSIRPGISMRAGPVG